MTAFTTSTINYPEGADTAIRRVKFNAAPVSTNVKNFKLGDEWLNTTLGQWWKLANDPAGGLIWVLIGTAGAMTPVDSFTTTVSGPVTPTAGGDILLNASSSTYTDGSVANTVKTEVQGTNHALFIGRGTNTPATTLTAATNGQLPIGNTGNDPSLATLTSGTGISISNGTGSITVNARGSGVTWNLQSSSGTLSVNNGYICSSGGALSLALPSTSALGDILEVTLDGSTSWTITQAAGQQIRIGNSTTTLGVGGSVSSTAQGDSIRLVCKTANTRWDIISGWGNITFV